MVSLCLSQYAAKCKEIPFAGKQKESLNVLDWCITRWAPISLSVICMHRIQRSIEQHTSQPPRYHSPSDLRRLRSIQLSVCRSSRPLANTWKPKLMISGYQGIMSVVDSDVIATLYAQLLHNVRYMGISYKRGAQWIVFSDCQSRGLRSKSRPGQKFGSRFLFHLHPLANSAMMSTLTVHCQWEDETMRERTGPTIMCRG